MSCLIPLIRLHQHYVNESFLKQSLESSIKKVWNNLLEMLEIWLKSMHGFIESITKVWFSVIQRCAFFCISFTIENLVNLLGHAIACAFWHESREIEVKECSFWHLLFQTEYKPNFP